MLKKQWHLRVCTLWVCFCLSPPTPHPHPIPPWVQTAFQLCTSRIEEVKRVAAEALAELGAGGEDLGGASADAGTAGASGPTPSAQEKAATEVSCILCSAG